MKPFENGVVVTRELGGIATARCPGGHEVGAYWGQQARQRFDVGGHTVPRGNVRHAEARVYRVTKNSTEIVRVFRSDEQPWTSFLEYLRERGHMLCSCTTERSSS